MFLIWCCRILIHSTSINAYFNSGVEWVEINEFRFLTHLHFTTVSIDLLMILLVNKIFFWPSIDSSLSFTAQPDLCLLENIAHSLWPLCLFMGATKCYYLMLQLSFERANCKAVVPPPYSSLAYIVSTSLPKLICSFNCRFRSMVVTINRSSRTVVQEVLFLAQFLGKLCLLF